MERPNFKYLFVTAILLCISFIPNHLMAQNNLSFLQGFGVEIGGGYNQLFWDATDLDGSKVDADRIAFSLMPAARISYDFKIIQKFNLYSFLGYNEFGGHSDLDQSDVILNPEVRYKDQIKFKNIEGGIFGSYSISSFNIGVGAKVNYHFDIEQRYYYENHPQGNNGWSTADNSFFFNNWSFDAGIRLEYPIFKNYLLATEGWLGLTDLGKDKYPISVRENHFRLMIGYRF